MTAFLSCYCLTLLLLRLIWMTYHPTLTQLSWSTVQSQTRKCLQLHARCSVSTPVTNFTYELNKRSPLKFSPLFPQYMMCFYGTAAFCSKREQRGTKVDAVWDRAPQLKYKALALLFSPNAVQTSKKKARRLCRPAEKRKRLRHVWNQLRVFDVLMVNILEVLIWSTFLKKRLLKKQLSGLNENYFSIKLYSLMTRTLDINDLCTTCLKCFWKSAW